jgi:hypothetical protein
MPNSDLISSLLSKLYENQLALEAPIMGLPIRVRSMALLEQQRTAFHTLVEREEFSRVAFLVLNDAWIDNHTDSFNRKTGPQTRQH